MAKKKKLTVVGSLVVPVGEQRKPFFGKCKACMRCFVAAYLPMPVDAFVKIMRCIRCPYCGGGKHLIPKQEDGKLLEPMDPRKP